MRLYKHPGSKWFDGFDTEYHEFIVFDEFNNNVPTTVMNKVADGSICSLEFKGGVTPKHRNIPVAVLTNLEQYEIYPNQLPAIREAFFSRFTWIRLEENENPWRLWLADTEEEDVTDDDLDIFSLMNFET